MACYFYACISAINVKNIDEDFEDDDLIPAIMTGDGGTVEMSIEIPASISREFPGNYGRRAVSFQIFNVEGLFPSGIPGNDDENE